MMRTVLTHAARPGNEMAMGSIEAYTERMPGSTVQETGALWEPIGYDGRDQRSAMRQGENAMKPHMELAAKFLHPDYLQHNANFPQGRDALVRIMSSRPGRRPGEEKPITPVWPDPPFLTLINGPYSMMVWERTAKDPDDPSKDYKWYHYDMVRVENGVVREHWDEFLLNPAPAPAPAPAKN